MLGLVLGTLRLPLVLLVSGDAATAAGTNIAISAASAATGGVQHARAGRGDVDWAFLAAGVAGALPGGWLGAQMTGRFSELGLRRALGITLIVVGAAFVVEVIVR